MPNSKKIHRKAVQQTAPPSPAEPLAAPGGTSADNPWAKEKAAPDTFPTLLGQPPESKIGERISHCRRSLGLSVEALARLTKKYDAGGVSRTSILRYESGPQSPGARELRILSEALHAPVHWLLFGTKDPGMQSPLEAELERWLQGQLDERGLGMSQAFREAQEKADAERTESDIEKRRRWLWEAKRPPAKE